MLCCSLLLLCCCWGWRATTWAHGGPPTAAPRVALAPVPKNCSEQRRQTGSPAPQPACRRKTKRQAGWLPCSSLVVGRTLTPSPPKASASPLVQKVGPRRPAGDAAADAGAASVASAAAAAASAEAAAGAAATAAAAAAAAAVAAGANFAAAAANSAAAGAAAAADVAASAAASAILFLKPKAQIVNQKNRRIRRFQHVLALKQNPKAGAAAPPPPEGSPKGFRGAS